MSHEFATKFTGIAFILVAHFNVEMKDLRVTGRRPSLAVPQSPTSQHGELVVQHISLVREGWPNVTVGWANCATNECQLRTWEYLRQVHRRRFPDKRFALDRHQYAEFYVKAAAFFRERDMKVNILDAEPEPDEPPKSKRRKTSRPAMAKVEADAGPRSQLRLYILATALVLAAIALVLMLLFP